MKYQKKRLGQFGDMMAQSTLPVRELFGRAAIGAMFVLIMVLAICFNANVAYADNTWLNNNRSQIDTPEKARAAYYLVSNSSWTKGWANGTMKAPSEDYVEEIASRAGWANALAVWKSANFFFSSSEWTDFIVEAAKSNAKDSYEKVKAIFTMEEWSDFLEIALDKKDHGYSLVEHIVSGKGYYESILYDILYDSTQNSNYIASIKSKMKTNELRLLDFAYSHYGRVLGTLSADARNGVAGILYDELGSSFFGPKDKFVSYLSKLSTIEEMANKAAMLQAFQDVSKDTVDVLRDMKSACARYEWQTDSKCIVEAIDDMIRLCERDWTAEQIIAADVADRTITAVMKKMCNKLGKEMMKELGGPWKVLSSSYEISKTFCNGFLSTDRIIEEYYQMRCAMDFRIVLGNVVQDARYDYQTALTQESAIHYLAATDLYAKLVDLEYQQSTDFLKILDGTGINQVTKQLLPDWGTDYSGRIALLNNARAVCGAYYSGSTAVVEHIGAVLKAQKETSAEQPLKVESESDFETMLPALAEIRSLSEDWCNCIDLEGRTVTINGSRELLVRSARITNAINVDGGSKLTTSRELRAKSIRPFAVSSG